MSDAGWTIMSHESHGFCFCGEVHCSNGRECDSIADHPQFQPPTREQMAQTRALLEARAGAASEHAPLMKGK